MKGGVGDFRRLFPVPAVAALAAAVILALFFHPPQRRAVNKLSATD